MKEKPTVGSPFFRAFPSDRSPKAMKDVNVHSFIHSFTFRDELTMDSARPVQKKTNVQQNLFFPLSTWNFFLRGCDDGFHSEDCCFVCGSNRKHHVSPCASLLLRNLSTLSVILMT